jgi:hypothetical protein
MWKIPIDAVKPARKQRVGEIPNDLLTRLKLEKESGILGGIYHKVQIEFIKQLHRILKSGTSDSRINGCVINCMYNNKKERIKNEKKNTSFNYMYKHCRHGIVCLWRYG